GAEVPLDWRRVAGDASSTGHELVPSRLLPAQSPQRFLGTSPGGFSSAISSGPLGEAGGSGMDAAATMMSPSMAAAAATVGAAWGVVAPQATAGAVPDTNGIVQASRDAQARHGASPTIAAAVAAPMTTSPWAAAAPDWSAVDGQGGRGWWRRKPSVAPTGTAVPPSPRRPCEFAQQLQMQEQQQQSKPLQPSQSSPLRQQQPQQQKFHEQQPQEGARRSPPQPRMQQMLRQSAQQQHHQQQQEKNRHTWHPQRPQPPMPVIPFGRPQPPPPNQQTPQPIYRSAVSPVLVPVQLSRMGSAGGSVNVPYAAAGDGMARRPGGMPLPMPVRLEGIDV
ncbi:unnamed protein product, partial [Phaeothamnion confervicola]